MKAFSSLIFTVQKPELYNNAYALFTMSPLAQMWWAHSPSKACNFIVQWINT
jgi:hypothetical protein